MAKKDTNLKNVNNKKQQPDVKLFDVNYLNINNTLSQKPNFKPSSNNTNNANTGKQISYFKK